MRDPRLNRSLVLEGPVKLADGAGGYTRSWEPLGVLWAEVTAASGRKMAKGETSLSHVPLRITLRAAPYGAASRPKPGQRLVEGARIFNIIAVTEQGTHAQYLVCHAEEEVAP